MLLLYEILDWFPEIIAFFQNMKEKTNNRQHFLLFICCLVWIIFSVIVLQDYIFASIMFATFTSYCLYYAKLLANRQTKKPTFIYVDVVLSSMNDSLEISYDDIGKRHILKHQIQRIPELSVVFQAKLQGTYAIINGNYLYSYHISLLDYIFKSMIYKCNLLDNQDNSFVLTMYLVSERCPSGANKPVLRISVKSVKNSVENPNNKLLLNPKFTKKNI